MKHLYDIDDDDDYDDEEDEENLYTDADAPELSSANNDSCSVTPSIGKNYTIILKYCNLPCGHPSNLQSPMCLRTCSCPKNHVLRAGECKPMEMSTKELINGNSGNDIANEKSSPRDKRKHT